MPTSSNPLIYIALLLEHSGPNSYLLYIFLGVYPTPLTFLAAWLCVRDIETPPVKGTQKAKTPYTIFA
jgi:hypothetical protein